MSFSSLVIALSYTFSRSTPPSSALTKAGPSAGTRYTVAKNANKEKSIDAYSAGMAGKGSKSGRTKRQDAIGTKQNRRAGGSGRG